MKVLQINSVCGYGSTGRIATDLYDILIEQGHDCMIAYGRGSAPDGYNTYRIDSDWEVRLHGCKSRLTDKEGFGSRKATERFVEVIKMYNPDVIHLHNLHGYYINIEVLFDYLANADKPVIWTLHDCWAFTGHCSHFDYIGCQKWKTGCCTCPQTRCYPKSFGKDNSKWNYQKKKALFTSVKNMTIITPSHWLAGIVRQSYLQKYPVEVIYNGIDLDVFKPTPSSFRETHHCEDKKIVLGVASVWNQRKGLDTFVRLVKDLPEEDYQVVVVGLTKKQVKQMPEAMITIERTNSVTELAEIYTAADVFVNPTLEDNFPTTNLEALACETPVITYDTGGSPECLNDNCGLVIEKGNYQVLLASIVKKRYYSDYFNYVEIIQKFDKDERFNDYLRMYKRG